jgi:hypothetical protein
MYHEYEKKMQRADLFKVITENHQIKTALYPGSYIHISSSFFIPEVVYVDNDKNAIKFFQDESYLYEIIKKKIYDVEPIVRYHPLNYQREIPEDIDYFDLLISQYAGFISHYCKKESWLQIIRIVMRELRSPIQIMN